MSSNINSSIIKYLEQGTPISFSLHKNHDPTVKPLSKIKRAMSFVQNKHNKRLCNYVLRKLSISHLNDEENISQSTLDVLKIAKLLKEKILDSPSKRTFLSKPDSDRDFSEIKETINNHLLAKEISGPPPMMSYHSIVDLFNGSEFINSLLHKYHTNGFNKDEITTILEVIVDIPEDQKESIYEASKEFITKKIKGPVIANILMVITQIPKDQRESASKVLRKLKNWQLTTKLKAIRIPIGQKKSVCQAFQKIISKTKKMNVREIINILAEIAKIPNGKREDVCQASEKLFTRNMKGQEIAGILKAIKRTGGERKSIYQVFRKFIGKTKNMDGYKIANILTAIERISKGQRQSVCQASKGLITEKLNGQEIAIILAEVAKIQDGDGQRERFCQASKILITKNMKGAQIAAILAEVAKIKDDQRERFCQVSKILITKNMKGPQITAILAEVAKIKDDQRESFCQAAKILITKNIKGPQITAILAEVAKIKDDQRERFCKASKVLITKNMGRQIVVVILAEVAKIKDEQRERFCQTVKKIIIGNKSKHGIADTLKVITKIPKDQRERACEAAKKIISGNKGKYGTVHTLKVITEIREDLRESVLKAYESLVTEGMKERGKINLLEELAEFSIDKKLKNRLGFYMRLRKEISVDKPIVFEVINSIEISEKNSQEEIRKMFMGYLKDNILLNSEIQDFVVSLKGKTTSLERMDASLILLAEELIKDRAVYTSTRMDVPTAKIEIERSRLDQDPDDVLKEMSIALNLELVDGEKVCPSVKFKDKKGVFEPALDAGGPSRECFSSVYKGIHKMYQIDKFTTEVCDYYGGAETVLENLDNLGKLFMVCFHSRMSNNSKGTKLSMGCQLADEFFGAVLILEAKDCDCDIQDISLDKRLKITQQLEEPNNPFSTLLHKAKADVSLDDQREIFKMLYMHAMGIYKKDAVKDLNDKLMGNEGLPTVIKELLEKMKSNENKENLIKFNNAFKNFFTDKSDTHWNSLMELLLGVLAVQTVARGMKSLCPVRAEANIDNCWNNRIRLYSASQLSNVIQGSLDRKMIANAIVCGGSEIVKRKADYLRAWILDPETKDEKLKDFLFVLSGSFSFPDDKQIITVMENNTLKEQVMGFSTCAYQVDFPSNFDFELRLQGIDKSKVGKQDLAELEKKAFLAQIEGEASGTIRLFNK